jgi:hypothetical protein
VHFQIACLDITGFTVHRGAHVRTVVVMDHFVTSNVDRKPERIATTRDVTVVWPFTCVNSLVLSEIART